MMEKRQKHADVIEKFRHKGLVEDAEILEGVEAETLEASSQVLNIVLYYFLKMFAVSKCFSF